VVRTRAADAQVRPGTNHVGSSADAGGVAARAARGWIPRAITWRPLKRAASSRAHSSRVRAVLPDRAVRAASLA